MCGIAGILTTRNDLDLKSLLTRMQVAQRHRGPDDAGLDVVDLPNGVRLGLVQTRLAIQDLTQAAHQPMVDRATGSRIVYNGEIYNHTTLRRSLPQRAYVSSGDTETILAGWVDREDGFLVSLRGMFAFGVYDARRQRFWLVRDRLGVKPLYAARCDHNTWLFASEVRALLATGLIVRRLNPAAVDSFLAFGSVVAPRTLVEGVESLMPGESWRFDLDRSSPLEPRRTRYWRLPFRPRRDGDVSTRDEAVEAVRPVLREAIGLRMLSDVPVGVFLSGGIDSSVVVASLAAEGRGVTTLSVAFEERSHDESSYARIVAERFGTQHVELQLRSDKALAEFDEALASYDQPSVDGLNSYFVSQTAREAGITVALSGLGGDELFAGYPFFRYVARADQRRWSPVAQMVCIAATAGVTRGSRRMRKLEALFRSRGLDRYLAYRTLLPVERRSALGCTRDVELLPVELRRELDDAVQGLDAVNGQSLLELALYTANTLLRDTDQLSMAHALEVRVPLLDHELTETAARIPGRFKLAPGRGSRLKGLLVDALPVSLPEEAVRRRKMGFVLPWERWLRQDLRNLATETLTNRPAVEATGLDATAVATLWHEFLAGRGDHRAAEILGLINLVRWVQRHGFSIAAPTDRL